MNTTTYVATSRVEIELFAGPGSIELMPGEELELEHGDDGALWIDSERFEAVVWRQFRRAVEDGELRERTI